MDHTASIANCGLAVESLAPPENQDWVGFSGHALSTATGNQLSRYQVDLCGLQPADAVLAVSCGSEDGTAAERRLRSRGRYSGFGIAGEAIVWLRALVWRPHPYQKRFKGCRA